MNNSLCAACFVARCVKSLTYVYTHLTKFLALIFIGAHFGNVCSSSAHWGSKKKKNDGRLEDFGAFNVLIHSFFPKKPTQFAVNQQMTKCV